MTTTETASLKTCLLVNLKRAGITHTAAARLCGISRQHLINLFKHRQPTTPALARALSDLNACIERSGLLELADKNAK